jgi:hypothetical protein
MNSKAEAPANSERTTMTKILIEEATVKLALEALESERPYLGPMPSKTVKAITACQQALEQPMQAPVAWGYIDEYGEVQKFKNPSAHKVAAYENFQILYTTKPAAQPAPVTTREIDP